MEARIGTLKLVPASHSMDRLQTDCAKMKAMVYGDYPDFDTVMNFIAELEQKINTGK